MDFYNDCGSATRGVDRYSLIPSAAQERGAPGTFGREGKPACDHNPRPYELAFVPTSALSAILVIAAALQSVVPATPALGQTSGGKLSHAAACAALELELHQVALYRREHMAL